MSSLACHPHPSAPALPASKIARSRSAIVHQQGFSRRSLTFLRPSAPVFPASSLMMASRILLTSSGGVLVFDLKKFMPRERGSTGDDVAAKVEG